MYQPFIDVLTEAGGPMDWEAFVSAVRAKGARPEHWLKAKHAGVLETAIVNGELRVALPGILVGGA